jgi:hypothetical protein
VASDLPFWPGRLSDESSGTQVGEWITDRERGESRDALAPHRHEDLSAFGSVAHVAAELVMQLANADVSF